MEDKNLSMLIVDDEVEILQTFKEIFELRGWRIFTTPTGASALAIIEEEKINIVLLDVRLPDKSGLDILKDIKGAHPGLPVIIITGLGYEDDVVHEAIRLGASGYIGKNIPIRDMIEIINNALVK